MIAVNTLVQICASQYCLLLLVGPRYVGEVKFPEIGRPRPSSAGRCRQLRRVALIGEGQELGVSPILWPSEELVGCLE